MHIIGASGHAKVIVEILELNNQVISGVWDDDINRTKLLSYEIKGRVKDLCQQKNAIAIICIGDNQVRKQIQEQIDTKYGFAIHPSSIISKTAILLEGTVVMANATINSEAVIGKHAIINTNCSIDHDCRLGDFVHISPNAALAGDVQVGEGTHVGIGASIIQGIKIGKWVTIGAGSVVIQNVPDYAVVVGNPARVLKFKNF